MIAPTQQEVFSLHEAWRKAEDHFVTVYTNQARVLGVRPGRLSLHAWRNTFNGDIPDEGDDLLCQTCHRQDREASE